MTGLRGAWWRAQEQEQARRPPARPENIENRFRQPKRWAPSTVLEPAIEHTRPGAEQRARTTAIAIQPAAQNGTSGALAFCKHAGRLAACHAAIRKRYGRPFVGMSARASLGTQVTQAIGVTAGLVITGIGASWSP